MSLPRAILLHPNDGCLTLARALVRRGVEVHALTNPEYRYVGASRGVRGRVMPDVRQEPGAWMEELGALAEQGGGVVLTGSDATSEWLAENRSALPVSLRSFEATDGIHLALMDKLRLYRRAAAIGVRAPWMHHVQDRATVAALRGEVTYPCVMKARLGHVAKNLVGAGTMLIESRGQLVEQADRLLDHDLDLLVTEVVPGPETALEAAVSVRAADGSYTLEYGRRKVRQWPPDFGVGSLYESAKVPDTLAMNRQLLDHAGFHGISICEAKRHSGNGHLYLVEINVRVPAGFGLADACGVDGSWRLYATLAGLPLGAQPPQVDGRKCIIPLRDARAAWRRVRRRDESLTAVLRSWRGTRDFGVLSLRDPIPTVSLVRRKLGQRWAKLRARLAR